MDWLNRPYLRHFQARMMAMRPTPEQDAVSAWLDEIAASHAAPPSPFEAEIGPHVGEWTVYPIGGHIYTATTGHIHTISNPSEVYDGLAKYAACACGCELIDGHWYKS